MKSDRTVAINREKLVAQLKQNRENHKKVYEEALEGYDAAVAKHIEKCDYLLRKMSGDRSKAHVVEAADFSRVIRGYPPFPQNSISEYSEAIELMSWDEVEQVELTVREFRCYVLDKWDWQEGFLAANARYSETASAMSAQFGD